MTQPQSSKISKEDLARVFHPKAVPLLFAMQDDVAAMTESEFERFRELFSLIPSDRAAAERGLEQLLANVRERSR